jgi:hypothetical protein
MPEELDDSLLATLEAAMRPGGNIAKCFPTAASVTLRALAELKRLREAEPFSAELAALREKFPGHSEFVLTRALRFEDGERFVLTVGGVTSIEPTLAAAMRHFIPDYQIEKEHT